MSKFSRIQVSLKMEEQGLVPVFYHRDLEICKQIISACYKGGSRIFEYTNRGEFAHRNFHELVKYADAELPELILGAGSIMDAGTAALYIQEGANFIVSPVLKKSIAKTCNGRKILWLPGCGTVTEIARAEELGAEIIKAFPGSVLGPEFIQGVKGPMPWTKIMVSGGVDPTEESIRTWFSAGAVCVGMGSQLISKQIIQEKNFKELGNQVKKSLEFIKKQKQV
jgi:2-dehydro-3-deoxyphosphogluconate aldolase / (4S)-4-hydroxy-2-oxoglutarate aldolase